MNIIWSLFWLLVGAVVGNLTAVPTNQAVAHVHEWICPAKPSLAEGKALRARAIEKRTPALHRDANAQFEQAEACGNAEATAHIGMAYCHGWGVTADTRRGWQMIRTAFANGAALTPDWFTDPSVCPARKER